MRARTLLGTLGRDLVGRETTPQTDETHLQAAVEWLYRSQDVTDSGGCAATYNLVLGWESAYPETTGYIVPTLYDYAAATDSQEASERAQRMARWLLTLQFESGAFPAGTVGGDPDPSVFNTGQILLGLARAYAETGDDAFRESLREASRWLADQQQPEGYWSEYTYKGAIHSYTARVGWALTVAHHITGDDTVERAARRNLEWVRATQRENGTFSHCAFDSDSDPFLHTIAYTARGLVEGGHRLDDRDLFDSGKLAADRLLDCQRGDGSLAGTYDRDWNGSDFECLTGTAQTAVLWLRLARLTGETAYESAARRAIEDLKKAHRLDGSPAVRGGLAGSRPVWGPYMRLRYPNWAPKFFVDALLAASRPTRGDGESTAEDTRSTLQP